MNYTILSAQYANAEHTAALVVTEEAGAVLVSEQDTPEVWEQMLAGTVTAYVAPDFRPTVIEEFKAEREKLLNRMMSIAGRKARQSDAALASALDWMAEQIIPLDTHPTVVAATDAESMRDAFVAAYKQIVTQALTPIPNGGQFAPDMETALTWKVEVDKVFK